MQPVGTPTAKASLSVKSDYPRLVFKRFSLKPRDCRRQRQKGTETYFRVMFNSRIYNRWEQWLPPRPVLLSQNVTMGYPEIASQLTAACSASILRSLGEFPFHFMHKGLNYHNFGHPDVVVEGEARTGYIQRCQSSAYRTAHGDLKRRNPVISEDLRFRG